MDEAGIEPGSPGREATTVLTALQSLQIQADVNWGIYTTLYYCVIKIKFKGCLLFRQAVVQCSQ